MYLFKTTTNDVYMTFNFLQLSFKPGCVCIQANSRTTIHKNICVYLCTEAAVRTLPCLPVLYIYPNQVSGLSLPCLPVVHIYLTPTYRNPSTLQTEQINSVSLLLPTQIYQQYISRTIAPHVSSLPTYFSPPYLPRWLPSSSLFSMNQHQLY